MSSKLRERRLFSVPFTFVRVAGICTLYLDVWTRRHVARSLARRKVEVQGLTCATACTGVDGFVPLVGAGHGEGALVHAIFTAAKRQPTRLEGRATVGVRSS